MLRFLLIFQIITGTLLAAPFRTEALMEMDRIIECAVTKEEIPGCVIWLEHKGEVYRKAYGYRARLPEREEMTEDTHFDAASLTKVLSLIHI